MNDVEKIQPHINALDDSDLEEVSGGLDPTDIYTFNLTQKVMDAAFDMLFGKDVATLKDNLLYEKVMNTLATYDNPNKPFSYRCEAFARSWNKVNNSNFMTPELAGAILSIDNKLARAKIANLSEKELREKIG